MPGAVIAAELGGGDRQHGTQAFAAAVDQVMGEFRDQLDVGHGLVENDAIDRLHVLVDEVHQRFQVLGAFARLVEWYNATQSQAPNILMLNKI